MGFSVSASAAILFVAFLIMGMTLFESLDESRKILKSADETITEINKNQKYSEISLTSVHYDKKSNNLTLLLKNDSDDIVFFTEFIDVLIDGNIIPRSRIEYGVSYDREKLWLPTEICYINITNSELNFTDMQTFRPYNHYSTNLVNPTSISVNDKIYIIDDNDHIDVFTTSGVYKRNINSVELTKPRDIAVTDYIYVIDDNNHVDRLSLSGSWVDRLINPGQSRGPKSISVSTGLLKDYIFIVSNTDGCIYRFDIDGKNRNKIITNTEVDSPELIQCTDIIYVLDYSVVSGYHIDTFDLNGNLITAGLITNIDSPADFTVSDQDFSNGKIYIVENSNKISIYDLNGTRNTTITDGLSNDVCGIDTSGKIFIIDKNNYLVIMNLGCKIKIITEFGYSKLIEI